MRKHSKLISVILTLSLILALTACGGGKQDEGQKNEVVTLRWVTVGNGMPDHYDAWSKKINAYLEEKIGVNIDMEVVPWGDWENRRSVIVNTSGEYDILFTNGQTFNKDVQVGAFADISDIVEKTSPELYKMIPLDYWDACKIDGKIYAVPTYKDSSQSLFMVWDKALIDKLGIDAEAIKTLDDMTPALEKIKEDTGSASFPMPKEGAVYVVHNYDAMNSGLPALGVRYDDEKAKVVYTFEQEDAMKNLQILHSWFKAGIINADAATKPEIPPYKPASIAQGWSGAAKTAWGPQMGIEAVAYQWEDTIVSNDTVRGSLNCISSNSKNPEKALEFLQLINTDSYVRDSFYYGLEGEDWEYNEEGKVHRIKTDWQMAGYTQASFFTVTPSDELDFNQWDEVLELNKNAKPSVLLGFTLDTSKIGDQLINCISIYDRYKGELLTGTADPVTTVPTMLEELRGAGYDEIVTEAQKQVDDFLASKK